MINKKVAIAALARDCEVNLPGNIARIEELRKGFKESFVFVYENNSKDKTKEILEKWQSGSNNVYILSEVLIEENYKTAPQISKWYKGTSLVRIQKMCDCRNKLMSMIKRTCTPDVLIVVDSDVEWFSVQGIINAIENAPKEFGALFSNCYMSYMYRGKCYNMPLYYDTFAFLEKGRRTEDVKIEEIHALKRFALSNKINQNVRKNAFYECESAFGGIGVYNYDLIKNLDYKVCQPNGWKENGLCMCEHILFNENIKNKKYIAKSIEVRYGTAYGGLLQSTFIHFLPRIYGLFGIIRNIL